MERNNVVSIEEYQARKFRELALARAAYWAVRVEDAYKAVEVAERERESALRDAGMLTVEKGVEG